MMNSNHESGPVDNARVGQENPTTSAPVPAQAANVELSRSSLNAEPPSKPHLKQIARDGLIQLIPENLDDESQEGYNFDVIAIHGLGGHPRKTWTYDTSEGEIFWLYDFLPQALPGARIFTYGYNSEVLSSPSQEEIYSYAGRLLTCLTLKRNTPSQLSRPIIFICHSMGGLVCKASLIIANEKRHQYSSILESTKAIFFFATPHRGSKTADAVLRITRILKLFPSHVFDIITGKSWIRRDLMQDLSTSSKKLERLHESFSERAGDIPCIVSFREAHKYRGQLIVNKGSASIGVAHEDIIDLPSDHVQICRLKDEQEVAYRRIVQGCLNIGPNMSARSRTLSTKEQHCINSLMDSIPTVLINPEAIVAKSTCNWIFSTQQYRAWRDSRKPVLWISGQFGCGKTTLMSFLKQQLSQPDTAIDGRRRKADDGVTVCGFFFNHSIKDLANATALLQCVIWDLIVQRHDLVHHVLRSYQELRPWSYSVLWHVLEAILNDPLLGSAWIIIDALDVCERGHMASFLENLVQYLEKCANRGHSHVRFIISSRPALSESRKEYGKFASYLLLDQDVALQKHTTADIRQLFVNDLLDESQVKSADDPNRDAKFETLADKFAVKSEGSFLWASLVLEGLHREVFVSLSDVENYLSECPPKLYSIYCDALSSIRGSARNTVLKSLHVILAARRPLTRAEFETAVAIENNHSTLEALKQTMEDKTTWFQEKLSALIRIDGSVVTLRHQSVRDFLLNRLFSPEITGGPNDVQKYQSVCIAFAISMNEAENTLATCCINFLNIRDLAQTFEARNEARETRAALEECPWPPLSPLTPKTHLDHDDRGKSETSVPFSEYAATNWACHCALSDLDEQTIDDALKLLSGNTIFKHWVSEFRESYQGSDRLPEQLDASVVAAYFGQRSIMRRLTSDHNSGFDWASALTWACRMSQPTIVRMLIDFGVPYRGAVLEGRSAFLWAAARGSVEIVATLLECDRDLINIQDDDGCCPLALAVNDEHLELVEYFMSLEDVNVNLCDNGQSSPIAFTIGRSNPSTTALEILTRLLHDPRVDITIRDCHNRTFLSYLAAWGQAEAIQILLTHSQPQAAVDELLDDSGDTNGFSPLSHAAWWGHTSVVRLLCRTHRIKTQLESVDTLDGANVFDLAATRGHVPVILELGSYYPEGVNSQDQSGRTPLSTAMWGANPAVLRALLRCGADVNLPDKTGKPPVAHGIGRIEMVEVLAEHGADLNARDHDGHTPLWFARHLGEELQAQLRRLGATL